MADLIPTLKVEVAPAKQAATLVRGGAEPGQEGGQPFAEALATQMEVVEGEAIRVPAGGKFLPPGGVNLLDLLEGQAPDTDSMPAADRLAATEPAPTELAPDAGATPGELLLPGMAFALLEARPESGTAGPESETASTGRSGVAVAERIPSQMSGSGRAPGEGFLDLAAEILVGDERADAIGRTPAPANGATLDAREGMTAPTALSAVPGQAAAEKPVPAMPFASFLEVPVGKQGWSEGLGNRVVWLVNQNQQSAELRLNPPHLGPLEVRITINQDQASVAFTAHHAVTREALEAAVPRLREMLGEQGLNLVNVDVSQHSFAQHQGGGAAASHAQYPQDSGSGQDEQAGNVDAPQGVAIARGLVDYYA